MVQCNAEAKASKRAALDSFPGETKLAVQSEPDTTGAAVDRRPYPERPTAVAPVAIDGMWSYQPNKNCLTAENAGLISNRRSRP
jgi:hypothetical protein